MVILELEPPHQAHYLHMINPAEIGSSSMLNLTIWVLQGVAISGYNSGATNGMNAFEV